MSGPPARLGGMPQLPDCDWPLLVRTDFASDAAWEQLSAAAQAENADGFQASLEPVSDPGFNGASWPEVKAAVPEGDQGKVVLFIADSTALASPEQPILVVDLWEDREPYRCIAAELWGVENNLSIANMDWLDFADAVDPDGVFRGFR